MRSQASKTLPKKGALGKTAFKGNSASKSTKKKLVSPKKTKNLPKAPLKGCKKNKPKDEASGSKSDTTSVEEKNDLSSETAKAETSKACQSRNNSPAKKVKKDTKEKKDTAKNTSSKVNTCTVVTKKRLRTPKIIKPTLNTDKVENKNDDAKYKINLETAKKPSSSLKAKVANKKGQNPKKKIGNVSILQADDKVKITDDGKKADKQEKYDPSNTKDQTSSTINDKRDVMKIQNHSESKRANDNSTLNNTSSSNTSASHSETPKTENERPPKFFTSSRSPRTVDIDVKCCKYSKGNLSVSERFLTMKCESKHEDNNKEKYASNHLVSQGAEIDVYTFTDKVDSPKSILSDFRNPINKSIGRVRPIARVKGTVIDKKTDTDRKKYSPHRPIEEVVKQLKANKRSEDINLDQKISGEQNSEMDSNASNNVKKVEDKPPPIVSKSYKMVARKSSITGKPFSPIKFLDESESPETQPTTPCSVKSSTVKQPVAKKQQKSSLSDEDINTSKFLINKKSLQYTSSEESVSESNDDNESNESSGSDTPKAKKTKKKKFKRITDSQKKPTSKELKELSKDSLIDLKDNFALLCNEKPSKRRLKLLSMWAGPKKHRMASLNAIAKVHCLYENESRTHMELGLMKTVDRQAIPSTSKTTSIKKKETKVKETEQNDSTSESEYEVKRDKKEESSDSSDDNMPQRTLRGVPGIRSAGKYWDPKSSTSSSEDSELEIKTNTNIAERKKTTSKVSAAKSDSEKPPPKLKKTAGVPVKKKRNRNEVVMDLKDMVVQKRMASLNATAILAASYEKRSPKSSKDDTTSDSCSDESFTHKSINITSVGVKSEVKNEDIKKDSEDSAIADRKQKVEVIVNQDTDVTITGVYSTHHEGFCTVSGMQYRISSTSHTQTTATANCEKEGCTREEGSRYTPLSALSSMQPPAEHTHTHPHPVPELGGLNRRPGCSSAFSAPSPSAHHDPGYYQPAGPLIKETSAEADRALGRYHPPPHYHPPHPSVLQQYGPPYYPAELCYGRYYRPPGPYHIPPPQPDAQMVGVGSEPYPPPPQYYGTPPCYQHSPQRIPYVEYRGCPCPLNACPKNVLIGPATGKAPAGGGPADVHALAPPGGAFRGKVRACALDSAADTHGSGKDPPLEPEPPAGADAPHPCPVPAIGGASPKRELYDVRENLRLAGDIPGPTEAIGPPSPARGSAGACAPQPPPIAPRRARLGKAMARRTLAGDDTSLLLSTPQQPAQHSDADDDVLAISPPICVPIDLSSSDERSTPLVDVKKENEGPKYATPRKADTLALREHNSSTALLEMSGITDANKSGKRRYSKPKLEIDIRDIQLDESCKTNGIGEHVKLQKRRKVSGDQTDVMRTETVTKETKKKTTTTTKRNPRSPPAEKKTAKRKLENSLSGQKVKKALSDSIDEDQTLKNISCVTEEPCVKKPKTKSALLLDNLIRKNSIDGKGYSSDTEINPAELFLAPNENITQNGSKKTLNINNNVVDNNTTIIGVRPKTIAAVSQLIEKKLAFKNACNIDSKITHNLKSVLKAPTDNADLKEERTSKMVPNKDLKTDKVVNIDKCDPKSIDDKREKDNGNANKVNGDINKSLKPCKTIKLKSGLTVAESNPQCDTTISVDESHSKPSKIQNQEDGVNNLEISQNIDDKPLLNKLKITADKVNGELKSRNVEKVVKLLVSKKQAKIAEESKESHVELTEEKIIEKGKGEKTGKRCKLAIDKESKGKSVDKLAKILITKNTALKTDEATLVVEDACASPTPSSVGEVSKLEIEENGNSVNTNGVGGRRTRRRRSGVRRTRRSLIPIIPPTLQPRPPPRWSNGWNWDGEHYVSKVYLNNDSRLDRTARCWARMWHASGDRVARGDCVLLRASLARAQPFVARVASLWENPEDGEMMVSLVWYYRPEHTERGRQTDDAPDEVFASRHRDANSVACIEDKCYVLTFNEYCRYRKRLKATEEGITIEPSIVPPMPASEVTPALVPNDTKLPPSVSPELVLFCRKIYDFRSKKVQVPTK